MRVGGRDGYGELVAEVGGVSSNGKKENFDFVTCELAFVGSR